MSNLQLSHLRTLASAMLATACLSLMLAVPANAQEEDEIVGRDPAYEQEIYDRLEQINPKAVAIFRQATLDMDRGDFAAARSGFEQVLDMADDFPDAARRLSSVEIALGDAVSALSHADLAYRSDPSAYNRSALAYALLATGVPEHLTESLEHAQAAADELPNDPFANYVLSLAAYSSADREALRQGSQAMIRLILDDPLGHFFAGTVAAEDGHWLEAERQLLLSQELGMPAAQVEQVLAGGVRTQARIQRGLRNAGYGLASWAGGLALLFVAGTVLSSATLRAVSRAQVATVGAVSRAESLLRSVYRGVIALTSAYFFISIPLLILAVLGLAGAVYYLFFVIGQIPVRLAAFVGIAALYTVYAIVRSIFAKLKQQEPGRALPRDQARIYNPAWLFVNGFYRIFLRITLGASRLQEILADRYAALAYGSQQLADGLRHLIRQSLAFNKQVAAEVRAARQAERELGNLYALPPIDQGEQQTELEAEVEQAMNRPTSAYDSHPAPKDRLALLAELQSRTSAFGDDAPASDLLPNLVGLQTEMTMRVQRQLDNPPAANLSKWYDHRSRSRSSRWATRENVTRVEGKRKRNPS